MLEYNRSQFTKVNDHKVLHKVKKHWVVLSMALLSAIGATGALHITNVHASGPALNLTNRRVTNASGSAGLTKTVRSNQSSTNAGNTGSQNRASVHDLQRADQIRDRILNRMQYPTSAAASGSASVTSQVSGSSATPASSTVSLQDQPQVGSSNSLAAKMNSLSGTYQAISSIAGKFNLQHDLAVADQTSNAAWAEINRYSWIDPQDVNRDPSSPDYGSAGSYGFQDSSAAALTTNQSLRGQISSLESAEDYQIDSFNGSSAMTSANQLNQNIQTGKAPASDARQLDQLGVQLNSALAGIQGYSALESTTVKNVAAAGSSIKSDFASVSAAASRCAQHLNRAIPATGSTTITAPSIGDVYSVADVQNINEFLNAIVNPQIHQVNIMKNMNTWVSALAQGTPNSSDDIFYWMLGHNVVVNGLNDAGKWNTIDMGHFNADMYNPGSENFPEFKIKDLSLYGNTWWGPFSINNGSVTGLMVYDNVNYVGTQLAYDNGKANSIFEGRIRANCGAAYSPDGVLSQYGYKTNGLPAHPYTDETVAKGALPNNQASGYYDLATPEDPTGGSGLNTTSNQQFLQVYGNGATVFKPNCDFQASTTNADCIEFDGNGGTVSLNPGAHVTLIPRGAASENTNLPSGVNILSGNGNVDVDRGAFLHILPSIATDPYVSTKLSYAPSAINVVSGSGDFEINPGGTVRVDYPDVQGRMGPSNPSPHSLPAYGDGLNAIAAISMNGTSKIHVGRYGTLIVNGGQPSNAAGNDGISTHGSLVSTGNSTGGNVQVDPHSNVRLSVGGSQPVVLFDSGANTRIQVDDPKRFSLNFMNNNNDKSQLASNNVGIRGNNVTVYDQYLNKRGNPDHCFGQFSQVTFPGNDQADFALSQSVITNLGQRIENIKDLVNNWLTANGKSSDTNKVDSAIDSIAGDPVSFLKNYGIPVLLPNGTAAANSSQKNQDLVKLFNDSLDIENIAIHEANDTVFPSLGLGTASIQPYTKNDVDGSTFNPARDEGTMSYAGQNFPIIPHGFNLSKGFSFEGTGDDDESTPKAYVEGIQVDPDTNVISGYAAPGSYIRLNKGDDQNGNPAHPGTPVVNPSQPTYDSHSSYDPDDLYVDHSDYVAVAGNDGYWSYQLPAGTDLGQLVVTAHTASALQTDAARRVQDYGTGIQSAVNKGDTVASADRFAANSADFPRSTYPIFNSDDPAADSSDPTLTDDDDTDIGDNKHQDSADDSNAGFYFWAGRLDGTLDRENATFNPESAKVEVMPHPFIVGYLTAKLPHFDAGMFNDKISGIIKKIKQIQRVILSDYLPPVRSDNAAAGSSLADVNATLASLDSLLTSTATYDPYLNLQSLVDNLETPAASVSDDDSKVSALYSSVSAIDDSLTDFLDDLNADGAQITADSNNYNSWMGKENDAARASKAQQRKIDLALANQYVSSANAAVESADADSTSASNSERSASNDNQAASAASNAAIPDYGVIRTSASNSEASDFSSVVASYSASASYDQSAIDRYSEEVESKYLVISALAFDQSEINSLQGSLSTESGQIDDELANPATAGSLHDRYETYSGDVKSAISAVNSASNAINDDSTDYASWRGSAFPHFQNTENYMKGMINNPVVPALTRDQLTASGDEQDQSKAVQSGSQLTQTVANAVNAGDLTTASAAMNQARVQFNRALSDNSTVMNSLIDTPAARDAYNDLFSASSAWDQARSAKVDTSAPANVEAIMQPMLTELRSNPATGLFNRSASGGAKPHSATPRPVPPAKRQIVHGTYALKLVRLGKNGEVASLDVMQIQFTSPVGSTFKVDPLHYLPAGFHPAGDQAVIERVTPRGLSQKNVTFSYKVGPARSATPSSATHPRSASSASNPASKSPAASSAGSNRSKSTSVNSTPSRPASRSQSTPSSSAKAGSSASHQQKKGSAIPNAQPDVSVQLVYKDVNDPNDQRNWRYSTIVGRQGDPISYARYAGADSLPFGYQLYKLDDHNVSRFGEKSPDNQNGNVVIWIKKIGAPVRPRSGSANSVSRSASSSSAASSHAASSAKSHAASSAGPNSAPSSNSNGFNFSYHPQPQQPNSVPFIPIPPAPQPFPSHSAVPQPSAGPSMTPSSFGSNSSVTPSSGQSSSVTSGHSASSSSTHPIPSASAASDHSSSSAPQSPSSSAQPTSPNLPLASSTISNPGSVPQSTSSGSAPQTVPGDDESSGATTAPSSVPDQSGQQPDDSNASGNDSVGADQSSKGSINGDSAPASAEQRAAAGSDVSTNRNDHYVSGVNDARQGNLAQSNDSDYRSGYRDMQQATEQAETGQLPKTGDSNNARLTAALLLLASLAFGGVTRRRRHDE